MSGTHNNDLLDIEKAAQIRDSDELRNINSYEYLLQIITNLPAELPPAFQSLQQFRTFFQGHPDYISQNAYGDVYTAFLLTLEEAVAQSAKTRQLLHQEISQLEAKTKIENMQNVNDLKAELAKKQKQLQHLYAMDNVIDLVYANPNHALERSANMISTVLNKTSNFSKTRSQVRRRLMGTSGFMDYVNKITSHRNINKTSPQKVDSHMERLSAQFARNYKPQTTTSMASIRSYDYKDATMPLEYRFGTQGQYHNGIPRVNPVFEEWLDILERKPHADTDSKIDHLYLNNLGFDRWDFEGQREQRLSLALHEMEEKHKNIVVITLPSDKGLMSQTLLTKHQKTITPKQASEKILGIATGNSEEKIKDFYISERAKKLLYGEIKSAYGSKYDKARETQILTELLKNSFEKLGIDPKKPLSEAQFQALYFHFIKYEVTNYIIKKLNPISFNISCKDAIDRGGVSSAYFNLIKSIESGAPMSKDEFNRALHAGSTLVKGRGMNHHIKLLWNAIDAYLEAPMNANNANIPDWLKTWRNENAPEGTRQYYINQLNTYIKPPIETKNKSRYTLFATPKTQPKPDVNKINAAQKILQLIVEPDSKQTFSHDEQKALRDRELKKMVSLMKKQGLVDLDEQAMFESSHRTRIRT